MNNKLMSGRPPYHQAVIFYLLIQIFIIIGLLSQGVSYYFFWYCYHIPFFYALAFHYKKPQIIIGLMHVGLVVQLTWITDLVAHLFGGNISDQTTFIFQPGSLVFKIISIITHLFVPITALIWTYKLKPLPKSLLYSSGYIAGLYLITLFFSQPERNLNCVFSICSDWVLSWHYTLLWPIYLMTLAVATYGLHRRLYEYFKKQK